jgi:hypothetical protein
MDFHLARAKFQSCNTARYVKSARMKADIRAVETEKLKARLERFVASVIRRN